MHYIVKHTDGSFYPFGTGPCGKTEAEILESDIPAAHEFKQTTAEALSNSDDLGALWASI